MRAQEKSISDPHYGSILPNDLFMDQNEEPSVAGDARSFEANLLLFQPGDRCESIYILRSGHAAIYVDGISRGQTISTVVEIGRMYGILEAVGEDRMWYRMKTETKCRFDVMSRDKLLSVLSNDPALCFRLAQILSRMNRNILLSVIGGR
ncbi:MAG: cyclic nucleotide-binding domain-containing protein [Acidobacteriota bacterium]